MGLYAGGMTPSIDVAAIAEEMRSALYAWFSGRVVFYIPNRTTAADWNPVTDAGAGTGSPEIIYDTGLGGALVQPLRAPTLANFGDQNLAIIGCRVQIPMTPPDVTLRSGVLMQVLDGGNDEALKRFVFSVNEGIDSSMAWGRIIDTTVIQTATIPLPVTGDSPGYGGSYGEAYGA